MSHANMGVFWSGTDTATIRKIGGSDFFVSLVTNKAGDYRVRLDIYKPLKFILDSIPLRIPPRVTQGLRERCQEEVKLLVRDTKYAGPFAHSRGTYFAGYPAGEDADDWVADWAGMKDVVAPLPPTNGNRIHTPAATLEEKSAGPAVGEDPEIIVQEVTEEHPHAAINTNGTPAADPAGTQPAISPPDGRVAARQAGYLASLGYRCGSRGIHGSNDPGEVRGLPTHCVRW